ASGCLCSSGPPRPCARSPPPAPRSGPAGGRAHPCPRRSRTAPRPVSPLGVSALRADTGLAPDPEAPLERLVLLPVLARGPDERRDHHRGADERNDREDDAEGDGHCLWSFPLT